MHVPAGPPHAVLPAAPKEDVRGRRVPAAPSGNGEGRSAAGAAAGNEADARARGLYLSPEARRQSRTGARRRPAGQPAVRLRSSRRGSGEAKASAGTTDRKREDAGAGRLHLHARMTSQLGGIARLPRSGSDGAYSPWGRARCEDAGLTRQPLSPRLASPSQRGVTNKREEIERKWAKDSEIRRSTPSRRINRSASRERQRGRASSRSGTPSNSDAQQGRRSRRSSLSRERTQKRTIRGGQVRRLSVFLPLRDAWRRDLTLQVVFQARPATQANSTGQPGPATQASTTVQLSPTTQAGSTVQPSPATHASPAETEATAEQPGPELSSSTVRSEKDFAEFEATILKKLEAL
eukprot:scaffold2607_cov254-Pinguiococcus_pyrenoidosus.AAC.9